MILRLCIDIEEEITYMEHTHVAVGNVQLSITNIEIDGMNWGILVYYA